jgi:methionyl-tRNA synthetase
VRVPHSFVNNGYKGYLEDRRPNSQGDPYQIASRVLKIAHGSCGGSVPAPSANALTEPAAAALWAFVRQAVDAMESQIAAMRPDLGLAAVMQAIREANKYVGLREPWKQAKAEDKQPLADTLYLVLESLRVCSALLWPVMPSKMKALRAQIGADTGEPSLEGLREFGVLTPGAALSESETLFPRYQVAKTEEPKAVAAPKEEKLNVVTLPEIEIGDFGKVQLRVAKVLEAERVPGADKLLKLQLDVGGEARQIVAGIALHYAPEQVVGKNIIIVANLKPAQIRGVESRGMLLAASAVKTLTLVTTDDPAFASGARVG